jgi:hypothetical protein
MTPTFAESAKETQVTIAKHIVCPHPEGEAPMARRPMHRFSPCGQRGAWGAVSPSSPPRGTAPQALCPPEGMIVPPDWTG